MLGGPPSRERNRAGSAGETMTGSQHTADPGEKVAIPTPVRQPDGHEMTPRKKSGSHKVQSSTLHIAMDLRFWESSGLGTFQRELLSGFSRAALPLRFTFIGAQTVQKQVPQNLLIERWINFEAPIYSARAL